MAPPRLSGGCKLASNRFCRAFELDLIAVRVEALDRWAIAFSAVASDSIFRMDSMGMHVVENCLLIERLNTKAEVIDVSPFLSRCAAATGTQWALDVHQVNHRAPGTQMDHAVLLVVLLDLAAQHPSVEVLTTCHVLYAQDDVVKAEVLLLDLSQRGEITGDLFAAAQPVASEKLMGILDTVNARWGRGIMRLARVPVDPSWGMRREMMSQSYTTKIDELWTVYCK